MILLVLKDQTGRVSFFVHPELRMVVLGEDFDFIESLIRDLLERAKLHPEALFKHLSSLGVGPIVTQEVGESLSAHPSIKKLSSCFVERR
jgi:hypothetical protein